MEEKKAVMIKVMCGDKPEARRISESLLERRLIACANIIGPVDSIFRWKGKVESEQEFALLMKTQERHIDAITGIVSEIHSYELPEVSALPIIDGSAGYIEWIIDETETI